MTTETKRHGEFLAFEVAIQTIEAMREVVALVRRRDLDLAKQMVRAASSVAALTTCLASSASCCRITTTRSLRAPMISIATLTNTKRSGYWASTTYCLTKPSTSN